MKYIETYFRSVPESPMDLFASPLPGPSAGDVQVPEPGRTPPPARAPRTDVGLDLDTWDATPDPARRPRRWLLGAAVAPWLVFVVMLAGDRASPVTPPATDPAPTDPPTVEPTASTPAPTDRDDSPSDGPSGSALLLGGPAGPSSLDVARGLALVVARSWLSTRPSGPTIEGLVPEEGADRRYVEHVAVETVDHPARGAAVVVVTALVLPIQDDTYGVGEHVRVAVPFLVDASGARLGGPPWRLDPVPAALTEVAATPVVDVDLHLAATEALLDAGYRDVVVDTLARSEGWAWVVEARGRAPGRDVVETHAVWLRVDVDRLVVAGNAAPLAPRPQPTDAPSPEVTP